VTSREIADFIWLRWPPLRVDNIVDIIEWYGAQKLLGVITDNGAIQAVAMIRIVDSKEDGLVHYKHNPDGNMIWVDLVASDTKMATAALVTMLWENWGKKQYVGFQKSLRSTFTHVFPSRLLDKVLHKSVTAGLVTHGS
jgi:hypothetical protein